MAAPGRAGSQRRRIVGPELLQDIPKTRAACSKFALFLESKSRRPPRKISASSWHARSRQKLVTPIWLRQQQDFSTPRHVTMPSPFTHPGLQGNPLSTVWLSLDCALSESPPLLCPARDGSGPPPDPWAWARSGGVTLGPGPVTLPFGPSHGQGPLHHLPSGPSHGQGPVDHLSGHSAMTFAEPSDAAL